MSPVNPNAHIDAIRADQINEARRLAQDDSAERKVIGLPVSARSGRPTAGSRTGTGPLAVKKNILKGHEAFLKALEMNDAKIEIEKCDGTVYRGILRHTDKFTLTVYVTQRGDVREENEFVEIAGRDRVIFKHDISEFSALSGRPNQPLQAA